MLSYCFIKVEFSSHPLGFFKLCACFTLGSEMDQKNLFVTAAK